MSQRLTRFMVLVLILVCANAGDALAFRDGPPEARTGSPASNGNTCQACHDVTVGTGSIQILGVPTRYEPSQTYNITVRIADSTKVGAGFEISVEDDLGNHVGTLIVTDEDNTQFNQFDAEPVWINHTFDGVDNSIENWTELGNAAEFQLAWQAPATDIGKITFWAAGNAINDNFTPSGDIIYLANKSTDFFVPAVPALSEWGMVVLGMLMLVAATLVFCQRRRLMAV